MMSRLIRCQDHIISSRDFIWNNSAHYSVVVYDGNVVTDRISCSHFQCSRWPIPALWWHNATFSVVGSTVQSMIDSQTVDDRHPDSRWQNPLHCVVDDRLDGELVPRVTREEPEDGVTSSANLCQKSKSWFPRSEGTLLLCLFNQGLIAEDCFELVAGDRYHKHSKEDRLHDE